jgi:glycosyltransferase involved in cell wall biosynthesis
MKFTYGVYLESSFKYIQKELYCQDVYSKVLDLLASRNGLKFNYLIRISNKKINYNEVKYFGKIFILRKYKSLISLIPFYIFYVPFSIKKIREFVDDSDRIIIMIPSPIAKTIFKVAKERKKKVIILVRQDIVEMTQNRYFGLKRHIGLFFAKYYEGFFLKNITNKDVVITSGEKLRLRYLPCSKSVFNYADSRFSRRDVIKTSDLRLLNMKDKMKFIFVGRLEINKGIKELLVAALNFRHHIILTIVGDGTLKSYIRDFILVHNLSNTINCIGHIEFGSDLLKVYRRNDFFIFPSYSEGLPQVLLEAMASGCVVLTTDVGSIPYIVQNNVNGVLFKAHDQTSLNTTIQRLLEGSFNTSCLRKNGIKTALKYTSERQIEIFEKAMHS